MPIYLLFVGEAFYPKSPGRSLVGWYESIQQAVEVGQYELEKQVSGPGKDWYQVIEVTVDGVTLVADEGTIYEGL